MTDRLFSGIALTDKHINNAIAEIHRYFLDGGAAAVMNALGIGLQIREKTHAMFPELNEVISRRFIYLAGERIGEELTTNEVCALGLFLKHGPFYGKLKNT